MDTNRLLVEERAPSVSLADWSIAWMREREERRERGEGREVEEEEGGVREGVEGTDGSHQSV